MRVVDYVLHCGADAVVFPGVASEVEQSNAEERDRLVALVARTVADRVPLIVGASAKDLATSIRQLQVAASVGAAAAMGVRRRGLKRAAPRMAGRTSPYCSRRAFATMGGTTVSGRGSGDRPIS